MSWENVIAGLSPTHRFKLDEAVEASTVADSVGAASGALPVSGATLEATGGIAGTDGTALSLDGTASTYVDLTGLTNITGQTKFSFTCRVNMDSPLSGTQVVFDIRDDADNYATIYIESDGDVQFRAEIGGTIYSCDASAVVTAGAWHTLGVSLDTASGDRQLYLDGVAIGADNVNDYTSGSDGVDRVGARATGTGRLDGTLDELCWWYGTALSSAQHNLIHGAAALVERYEIYQRDSVSGPDTLVGITAPETLTFTLTGLAADSVGYYWIKPVSACGVGNGQAVARRLRRVAMDAAANLIAPAPNAPFGLQLTPGAGGQITATWRYRAEGAEAAADKFEVFVATGPDPFDFDTPTHTVSRVGVSNTQDLGTFADGTTVRCVVRALTQGDVAETNTNEATVAADATAPAAPVTLSAEVISG